MPFDYEQFNQKCDTLSVEELQKEWESYTRQIAGSSTSTATSVLCSPLTGGVSLIGLGLSAPRIHNARKKREIVEGKLQARGATHLTRKRDVAGSVALSGAVGGLTFGLLGPGADIVAHAAMDGAALAVDHTVGGQIKKSGLKDLEMRKLQEQQMMQQQYGFQGQFVGSGNVQMQQLSQGFQQPVVGPGTMNLGGYSEYGVPFQPQMGIQQQLTGYQPGLQVGLGMQQQQLNQYQSGPVNIVSPGMQYPQHVPSVQSDYKLGNVSSQQFAVHPQYPTVQQQLPQTQEQNLHLTEDSRAMYQQSFPEKTPAYTDERQNFHAPSHPQPAPSTLNANAQGENCAQSSERPLTSTMEEELAFLRTRIMQMELEKQNVVGDLGTSRSQETVEGANNNRLGASPLNSQTEVATQSQMPTSQGDLSNSQPPGSEPPHYSSVVAQSAPTQLQHCQPESSNIKMSIPPQLEHLQPDKVLQFPPQTQQHTSEVPLQHQQLFQQHEQLNSPTTSAQQYTSPPQPAPPQIHSMNQTSSEHVQLRQQVYVAQYQPLLSQNIAYQPSIPPQYLRQDSGYYSIASPSQQSSSVTQQHSQMHPQYNDQQAKLQGRNTSTISSISCPPPPYLPPSGVQTNLAGTDYFSQTSLGFQGSQ